MLQNTTATRLAGIALALFSLASQAQEIARTADGKPDLNGIWQAMGTAHWNLEPHNAQAGPVVGDGRARRDPGRTRRRRRRPHSLQARSPAKQRNENKADWLERDPW